MRLLRQWLAPRVTVDLRDWAAEPDQAALRRTFERMKTDAAQAVPELEALAGRGSLVSMILLGSLLYQGAPGLSPSPDRAKAWLRRAADGGSLDGLFRLSSVYVAEKDFAQARDGFADAAQKGYLPAMNALAGMYSSGTGGPADPQAAKDLCEKASLGGHVIARARLARLLMSGRFGVREIPRGFRLALSAITDGQRLSRTGPTELLR